LNCTSLVRAFTDWPGILSLYNRLLTLDASPVVALNRAVALARVRGVRGRGGTREESEQELTEETEDCLSCITLARARFR
jgi:predicted RNA polymerase sigma factor